MQGHDAEPELIIHMGPTSSF